MNRVIKYRVWDKKNKEMLDFFDLPDWFNRDSFFAGEESENSYFTLMQFIGLKDKCKKEIYEGDLFQVADNHIYEVKFITETDYGEKTCGFGLYNKEVGAPFIIDDYALENGKVIGNIYENKDLLK